MSKLYHIYLYIFIYINLYKGKSGTLVVFLWSQRAFPPLQTGQSGESTKRLTPRRAPTWRRFQHATAAAAASFTERSGSEHHHRGMRGSGGSQRCAGTQLPGLRKRGNWIKATNGRPFICQTGLFRLLTRTPTHSRHSAAHEGA